MTERKPKKGEAEKRAHGLLDEMERLEERRGARGQAPKKKPASDLDLDLGTIP